jgi:hypothetical protein
VWCYSQQGIFSKDQSDQTQNQIGLFMKVEKIANFRIVFSISSIWKGKNLSTNECNMNRTMNKIKWVTGVTVVFLLILATNLTDRKHFGQVKDSVVTIYEDRLVVKDIIYRTALIVSQKRLALSQSDQAFFAKEAPQLNDSIQAMVNRFYVTKLTPKEETFLKKLDEKQLGLPKLEAAYHQAAEPEAIANSKAALEKRLLDMKSDLENLSRIQLEEGKRQLHIANKALESVEFFTRLEIIFLVILGVAIQVLLLVSPKKEREFSVDKE